MSSAQSREKTGFASKSGSTFLLFFLMLNGKPVFPADPGVRNLALIGFGTQAKSWEPGVHVVPEHEPSRAIDGSLHTYWAVQYSDLPADLGIEWPQAQQVSSVVVRYFDGRMVRGPAMARTQPWARLQYGDQNAWKDVDAQIVGQETSAVRYTFSPITTTRLRLLYTELPDPESRRSPDKLGIYVCEFEAYRRAPFQSVSATAQVFRHSRNDQFYNEWGSDNPYDEVGPLVVEPKQSRIFTDTLAPTLIVAESRWAKVPASAQQSPKGSTTLKNGFLQLDVSTSSGLKETRWANLVTGEDVVTPNSQPFRIRTSVKDLLPGDFKVVKVDTTGSDAEAAHLRVNLTSDGMDLVVHYELRRQDHFCHKWLEITNKTSSEVKVLDVMVTALGLPRPLDLFAGPELTYPVSRQSKGGFFSCLETVYWDHQGDSLTYYPGVAIAPGKSFESDKAVVGVYRNRGEQVAGWDAGVRDWVIEYHAQVSPIPKGWPDIYLEGWSAKFGVEELQQRPEWAGRFFETAHKLGVRYMDAYEPTNLALLMPTDLVKRWVDVANRNEIATGWWNDFGSDYGWGMVPPYITPFTCKLSPEAERYFEKILDLVRTYNLRGFHWADFWTVWPCDQPGHGHLPGKYSIYAQGKRMVRFSQELHEAAPGLMLGADSGLDNPQYGRYADSRHHGGGWDTVPAIEPDLHLDRLYADMNRAYLYGLAHESLLRPWFRLLNCVNHFGMDTHHHDSAGYRYGLLSAIALAPQLTFNDAPDFVPESDIQFTQRWEKWAKDNQEYLRHTDRLFDRTIFFSDIWKGDAESLAGYSHIRGERGYIFLLNPGPAEQMGELTLALDAPASETFVVEELYPGGMTLQGPDNGEYPQGGKLRVTVPGKQVRILWIAPASTASGKRNLQAEDAHASQWRRYVSDWTVASHTNDSATLRSHFLYPSNAESNLAQTVPESDWAKEPWAYDKAYLVVLMKDEAVAQDDNWVRENFSSPSPKERPATTAPVNAAINGVAKLLRPFKTVREQREGMTRCFFVDLGTETKPGQTNDIEITLPIRSGLVFSGAYLDLPDQMPLGELASK